MNDDERYVQAKDPRFLGDIRTNFNPCRQRSLSAAQSTALTVAQLIGRGDLAEIAARAGANGEIDGCEVGYGTWEPADDAGWRRFGEGPDFVSHYESHTVRVTCRRGRKSAWVDLTYDRSEDVERVLDAVGTRRDAWQAWNERLEAAM